MHPEVHVDHSQCTACGSCVELCPSIFAWNEAGDGVIVLENGACDPADLNAAVVTCPQDCIHVDEGS